MSNAYNKKTGECKCQGFNCGYVWISPKLARTGRLPKECPGCKRRNWQSPVSKRGY